MLKTVFFGTPAVAVPFLEALARESQVIGVVSNPDRPVGRGYDMTPTPVKTAAVALGLPVAQPESLNGFSINKTFGPSADVGLVVAYGKLIPPAVFNEPRWGLVNAHFSLLPKYRGAAPMQWALIRGERETGVTFFQIERSLDTGPIFAQSTVPIAEADDAKSLADKLVARGLELQADLIRRWGLGPVPGTPQTGEESQAPMLKKTDGAIHWGSQNARQIANLVRGTVDWPGAVTTIQGHRLKLTRTEPRAGGNGRPGEVLNVERGQGLLVKCLSDALWVRRVKPDGKRDMDAEEFWNGARLKIGDCFE